MAVFEQREEIRKNLKKLLLECSFSLDVEIEIIWFTSENFLDKLGRYAQRIQAACISLYARTARTTGRVLYEHNPSCLICYYSDSDYDMKNVLNSRPMSFFINTAEGDGVYKVLENLIFEVIRENKIFHYTTKKTQLAVPIRNILYFQSDLKHVIICYCDGKEDRIFGKLSDIEQKLDEYDCGKLFVRIHKSYLVNGLYMWKLDKSEKMVELSEHSRLPVFEAQYPQTAAWFRDYKCSLKP